MTVRPDDLLRRIGRPTASCQRLASSHGGTVWRCGELVVKTASASARGALASEARSLGLLRDAGAPVPRVHHVEAEAIVMDHVVPGPADDEALGRAIAHLHGRRGERYGSDEPHAIATIPLHAPWTTDWREAFATRCILPFADDVGLLAPRLERAAAIAPLAPEGPTLVHGDLWSGNVLHGASGPVLIDPSAWWAERVVDLAMMALFGGFSSRCTAAYEEVRPLPDAVRASIPFHQLYFLLVHVRLFGSGYLPQVRRVLDHVGA